LIEKGYLKWKFADLTRHQQEGYREWIGRNVEHIKQQGRTPPENYTLEALEKADVGFAVVDIPALETRVVSAYIFMPKAVIPEWVTVVGTQAAGKPAYFEAHRSQMPELADKPYSDIKGAFPRSNPDVGNPSGK
jgi:hypothetical protein